MEETIAAVATGASRAAIGVIRLSGEGCIPLAARVFSPLDGTAFGSGEPRRLVLGTLRDGRGRALDQAMAVFFRAPASYTGEDACEFHCHGSPAVLALVLEALFAQGARQALPGEFTKRAFLNGKLDLMEAEAVADLIDAQNPAAARRAAAQLGGTLSRRVEEVYRGLVDLLAHFHAAVDYPDEDLAPFTPQTVAAALEAGAAGLRELLAAYDRGRYIKDGVPTAIVGRPNAGKSTLLNALVGYDRSIVTDTPGTTRDTVEERCVLGGVPLRLIDTAGLRETGDEAERLGVERSVAAMEGAGLILVVLDQSRTGDAEDAALVRRAAALAPTILVLNKRDLPCKLAWSEELDAAPACPISAKEGQGLEELGERVAQLFPQGTRAEQGEALANLRQAQAAQRALEALERAARAQSRGYPPDAVLLDVEEALSALGELTGQDLREDVVERIFERFCVGK